MAHIVHCRVCKQKIDLDSSHDWVMPATNWYYHSKCYADWIKRKGERALSVERTEEEWFSLLKDYVYRDIKLPGIDWAKITSQWNNFLKTKKFTPKGIYFAVIYFYEVQHGNAEMAKGGIGIVSNIYYDSAQYWSNLEVKRKGILEEVVQQIAIRQNRPILTIKEPNKARNRLKYSLDDILEETDD